MCSREIARYTKAHRLGMTPLEFYQKHGAKIIGDDTGRRLGGTGEGSFRAAMYRNNAETVQEFADKVLSGKITRASYFSMGRVTSADGLIQTRRSG